MKKAKPSKGSARTKKFDAGGLAALAGLGALAYMMRKKKDEEGSSKFDELKSVEKTKSLSDQIGRKAEAEPASTPSKFGGERNLGAALVETGTRANPLYKEDTDKGAEPTSRKTTPRPAAVKPAAVKPAEKPSEPKTSSVGMTGIPISTAGKANADLPSKPYPKGVKGRETDPYTRPSMGLGLDERQQARKDFLARRAAEAKEKLDAEAAKKKAKDAAQAKEFRERQLSPMKKGGAVKKYASGGSVSSASKRADGIAQRGKTKGRIC